MRGGEGEERVVKKAKGRGPSKPCQPAWKEGTPQLFVVGDGEFQSKPKCRKIVTTIRLLTVQNMPGPCQSWNGFSIEAREVIMKKFLQVYRWGSGKIVRCCVDVFENIASDVYCRELTKARDKLMRQYGHLAEKIDAWKSHPSH